RRPRRPARPRPADHLRRRQPARRQMGRGGRGAGLAGLVGSRLRGRHAARTTGCRWAESTAGYGFRRASARPDDNSSDDRAALDHYSSPGGHDPSRGDDANPVDAATNPIADRNSGPTTQYWSGRSEPSTLSRELRVTLNLKSRFGAARDRAG